MLTGPRRLRLAIEHLANVRGSSCYFIDLDPRFVKKVISNKQFDVARAYMEGIYKLNLPIIVMGTPNVQAEYERLRSRGVTFLQEPKTDQYGTTAVFDDTCGNYVQLHQD